MGWGGGATGDTAPASRAITPQPQAPPVAKKKPPRRPISLKFLGGSRGPSAERTASPERPKTRVATVPEEDGRGGEGDGFHTPGKAPPPKTTEGREGTVLVEEREGVGREGGSEETPAQDAEAPVKKVVAARKAHGGNASGGIVEGDRETEGDRGATTKNFAQRKAAALKVRQFGLG